MLTENEQKQFTTKGDFETPQCISISIILKRLNIAKVDNLYYD